MSNLIAKQGMSGVQLSMVQAEMNNKQKSKGIAYALWWFTGVFGGHRFYAGSTGIGVAMLLTLGGCGIWALLDVFFIGSAIERHNEKIEMDAINMVRAMNQDQAQ